MSGSLGPVPHNAMTGTTNEHSCSNSGLGDFYGLHSQQTPHPFSRAEPAPGSGYCLPQNGTQHPHTFFDHNLAFPFGAYPLDTSWWGENLSHSPAKPRVVIPRDTSYGTAFSPSLRLLSSAQSFSIPNSLDNGRVDDGPLPDRTKKRKQTKP